MLNNLPVMATAVAKEEYTFFWKNDSPFSQWYKSRFTVDEITFNSAEQYMMYQKAVLFDDQVTAKEILQTDNPKIQKQLGRKVKMFDEKKWNENCRDIVKKGNMAKFSQNPRLKEILLSTGDTVLVEASPCDRIWGIGLSEKDPRSCNKNKWRGKNWLGYALTDVKTELLAAKQSQSQTQTN